MKSTSVLLGINIVFTGLMAGLLFAFSCAVNPGLHSLPDTEYVHAMQSINLAIQNPLFLSLFIGPLVSLPMSCYKLLGTHGFKWMLTSMFLYGIGVFSVTIFFNVPLNEKLASFVPKGTDQHQFHFVRAVFETRWNFFHFIRTASAIVSFAVLVFLLTGFCKPESRQPVQQTL